MSQQNPTRRGQNQRARRAAAARRPAADRKPSPASKRAKPVRDIFVARPFEGLPGEAEWVALRELVPAATFRARLNPQLPEAQGRPTTEVTFSTVLPLAWSALVRPDGGIWVALQTTGQSGDLSRDLAASLIAALASEPATAVPAGPTPGPGPRLQDVLAADAAPEPTVHDNFDYWLEETLPDPEVQRSAERANGSVFPTSRMAAVPAAYWCRYPEKAHVRWVLPQAEDDALPALARLAARSELDLGDGTRFAGMFRAHGLLVPVWDLPCDQPAGDWEEPLAQLAERYARAQAEGRELDSAQRRARDGLLGRQVTLR